MNSDSGIFSRAFLGISLGVAVSVAVTYLLCTQRAADSSVASVDINTQTLAPLNRQRMNNNTTQGLKPNTYLNIDQGFKVEYPEGYKIRENDQSYQLAPYFQAIFSNDADHFTWFQVKVALDQGLAEPLDTHLDYSMDSSTMLDGETASHFTLEDGYCDAGRCSKRVVALKAQHNKRLYTLEFHGPAETVEKLQNNIIDSFRFVEYNQ